MGEHNKSADCEWVSEQDAEQILEIREELRFPERRKYMSKHIRILRKIVEKAAISAEQLEEAEQALNELEKMHGKTRVQMGNFTHDIEGDTVVLGEDIERLMVMKAVEHCDGNQSAAGNLLGKTRDWMRYKLIKYGLRKLDRKKTETASPDA